MKKIGSLTFIFLSLLLFSCTKENECDCQQNWVDDCNLTYFPGDLVEHNGICYRAYAQGNACSVEPGTQQGDIWEVCD